jgi:opacity protein-like surface antigen
MTIYKPVGVIAVLLAVAPVTRAADFYLGASFLRMTDKGDQASAIHPLALGARGGIELNPYLAVEARYASGFKSDSGTASGFIYDLDLNYLYGGYVKGTVPLHFVSPYVLLGYTRGKETATIRQFGLSDSAVAGGFSYGVGADFPITSAVRVNAEWARLIKTTDANGVGSKIEEISVGAAIRF